MVKKCILFVNIFKLEIVNVCSSFIKFLRNYWFTQLDSYLKVIYYASCRLKNDVLYDIQHIMYCSIKNGYDIILFSNRQL